MTKHYTPQGRQIAGLDSMLLVLLETGYTNILLTANHPQGVGVSPYPCAGDFPSVGRSIPPRCPISERTVPQSKTPLQGVNESLPPSAQMAVQPGGVLRFTIALNGAFCFRTYPLLRISWYRGVPFWNPLHLVAENSATKDHSAVLRAGSQAAAHPPGCPQFWGDPEHHGIFICTQHKNKPLCAFSMRQNVV